MDGGVGGRSRKISGGGGEGDRGCSYMTSGGSGGDCGGRTSLIINGLTHAKINTTESVSSYPLLLVLEQLVVEDIEPEFAVHMLLVLELLLAE